MTVTETVAVGVASGSIVQFVGQLLKNWFDKRDRHRRRAAHESHMLAVLGVKFAALQALVIEIKDMVEDLPCRRTGLRNICRNQNGRDDIHAT